MVFTKSGRVIWCEYPVVSYELEAGFMYWEDIVNKGVFIVFTKDWTCLRWSVNGGEYRNKVDKKIDIVDKNGKIDPIQI